jgi:hypothetical protein
MEVRLVPIPATPFVPRDCVRLIFNPTFILMYQVWFGPGVLQYFTYQRGFTAPSHREAVPRGELFVEKHNPQKMGSPIPKERLCPGRYEILN